MTIYVFIEGSCVIPKKAAYMDVETWVKVVKVVTPAIRTIKVSNVACVFPILFSVYLTIHPYPSKFSIYQSGGNSSHMMASSIT